MSEPMTFKEMREYFIKKSDSKLNDILETLSKDEAIELLKKYDFYLNHFIAHLKELHGKHGYDKIDAFFIK